MPKLLCTKCKIELTIKKSGVSVIEYAAFGPYKIWQADEYQCPECGNTIVAGFGQEGYEHYRDGFADLLTSIRNLRPETVRDDYESIEQRAQFENMKEKTDFEITYTLF